MPVSGDNLVRSAKSTAERFLGGLRPRWDHVQAVGRLAETLAPAFGSEGTELVAAAYLHDIGYAEQLVETGFHPLDGARFVQRLGHERLASLVANHSGARYEADLRGIEALDEEFPFADTPLDRALTYCDMTIGPTGRSVDFDARVAEIQSRYGAEHTVSRAIHAALPELRRAVAATEAHLAACSVRLGPTPGAGLTEVRMR